MTVETEDNRRQKSHGRNKWERGMYSSAPESEAIGVNLYQCTLVHHGWLQIINHIAFGAGMLPAWTVQSKMCKH